MITLKYSLLSLLLTAVVASQPGFAAGPDGHRGQSHRGISLDRAASRAREDYRGRIISAETEQENGRGSHKIRILTEDGRVRRLQVDPRTGEYLRPPRR